jgi:serpin B
VVTRRQFMNSLLAQGAALGAFGILRPTFAHPPSTVQAAGDPAFMPGLMDLLAAGSGNVAFSPWSIAEALSVALVGARGSTADALHAALGPVAEDPPRLSATESERRGAGTSRLNLATAVWVQQGIALSDAFRREATERHHATVAEVDFEAAPVKASLAINEWVSKATEYRVPALCSPESLGTGVRLLLASAVYFQAPWTSPFIESSTRRLAFRVATDREVHVPFMRSLDEYSFAEDERASFVSLPYSCGRQSMLLALPKNDVPPVRIAPTLMAILAGRPSAPLFSRQPVELSVPRFTVRHKADVTDAFHKLGLSVPFDEARADFGKMTASPIRLALSGIVHEAYVDVNESGTEAAGATGMDFQITSAPSTTSRPKQFLADHPFLFAIRDSQFGCTLFMGQVSNPAALTVASR